jgi:diketogulonate reductase-like aldo/keto reductase
MELRELGGTGTMVPEVGLGTWRYRGGVPPLRRGLELGANLIDTAEIYGTEDVVGQAIKDWPGEVFLATKVSGDHLRSEEVLKAVDASLRRLGLPKIDLYQVHWPNQRVPIAETMRAMEELVAAGKVRFVGVSNFSRREVEEAQAALKNNRIVSNQVEYGLHRREIEADLAFYAANKITVIAYSSFAQGQLLAPRSRAFSVLQAMAAEVAKTPAQVALNWCLSHPGVIVIPKSDHAERVEENCGASGWRLTPEQVAALDQAFR